METVVISVEVPKELQEAVQALVNVVAAASGVLKDGFQPASDLPAIISAVMANALQAVDGVAKIPAEVKENPVLAAKCAALAGAEIAAILLKK